MSCRFISFALVFVPYFAAASDSCEVPKFEEFATNGAIVSAVSDYLLVEMQPVAVLRVPSGFSKIGAMPNGSIGFGGHPKGISAVLGYETTESIAVYQKGIQPASFLLSIFKGKNAVGCQYLQGYQLELQDYRLHATFASGAEIFAYGKDDRHQFYLVRTDKPGVVLSGMFRSIGRADFESILSTIIVK